MKPPARLLTTQRKEKRLFPRGDRWKLGGGPEHTAQYVAHYLELNTTLNIRFLKVQP